MLAVLFLADIPDQVELLTLEGKIKMGFRDANGDEVEFQTIPLAEPVNTNEQPVAELAFPAADEAIDVGELRSSAADSGAFLDVQFRPGANRSLDYGSIIDVDDREVRIELVRADGTAQNLVIAGRPQPIDDGIDPGSIQGLDDDALIELLKTRGVQRFRYPITTNGFTWSPGVATVTFVANSWKQSGEDNADNAEQSFRFTILGPTAALQRPAGNRIPISEFGDVTNDDGQIIEGAFFDVTFAASTVAGATLAPFDPAPVPTLSGPGLGSITLRGPPERIGATNTYRYRLDGEFEIGEVVVRFAANTFRDRFQLPNTAQELRFAVDGRNGRLGPAFWRQHHWHRNDHGPRCSLHRCGVRAGDRWFDR